MPHRNIDETLKDVSDVSVVRLTPEYHSDDIDIL